MELRNHFIKFLKEIRPTENQRDDGKSGHATLRTRLNSDDGLKDIIVSTFLQGSYRRATAIRPNQENKLDVDVIVVTNIDKDKYKEPNKAMDLFVPFLQSYYKGKYSRQGRSIGIELSNVNLDMVITSAPSEVAKVYLISKAVTVNESPEDLDDWHFSKSWKPKSERNITEMQFANLMATEPEWKSEPLYIPDRDACMWKPTNPLEQIKWTWGKNARCNTHYVNVVKAIKWWQRINHDNDRPNGYPLEHLIGYCCPDQINSVAEGITRSMENIVVNFSVYALSNLVPFLPDHGVPEHNVLARVEVKEFGTFLEHVGSAAKVARQALDSQSAKISADYWRALFGDKFPPADDDENSNDPKGPFIPPAHNSETGDISIRRYAIGK